MNMAEIHELSYAFYSLIALLSVGAGALVLRQLLGERRERARMQRLEASGRHLPSSLHPVIDPEVCIGSQACVAACPEGDVLGVVDGAGRLIHGAACVGHGRCAAECPVNAIKLVYGTAERGLDIPYLSPNFETNRPGLYIAGELGGMGLIRNAIRQGVGAARHAIGQLRGARSADAVDVLIVGAGPAGLGAALACAEAGVEYDLIEQDTLGGTLAHFPRHKVVLTEPIEVPLFGNVHRAEMSKEELLALWQRIVAETRLQVRTGVKLLGVTGEDGGFRVETSQGERIARKVVLAIGRRGSPQRLGVAGEDAPHVTYHLLEPEQYRGRSVVVVGGGDSALEAASALCDVGAASVALSYRGPSFHRAKQPNRERASQLANAGRLTLHLETTVQRIDPDRVLLATKSGERSIATDFVIAALGGQLPTALLDQLCIRIDRWFGQAPAGAPEAAHVGKGRRLASPGTWLGLGLFALSLCAVALLANIGGDYYFLSPETREQAAEHASLRSSGLWGHGVGIFATLIMLTNFFYAARKRLGFLRRLGALRNWLTVHALVGLFTPAYIAFHAAFQAKNLIATVTFGALGAVVLTGIVGRFIYGRVNASGATPALKHLMRGWRAVHLLLAILMVLTISLHIAVSWLFGYRWVF